MTTVVSEGVQSKEGIKGQDGRKGRRQRRQRQSDSQHVKKEEEIAQRNREEANRVICCLYCSCVLTFFSLP